MEIKTRVVVYVPQDAHRRLKSKLALLNRSMSDWFRQHVEEELKSGEKILKKNSDVKDAPQQAPSKDLGTCSWDKTFKCTSPGTVFVKGKYWCTPHGLEV